MAHHFDLEEQEQLDQLKHFWNTWGTLITSVIVVACGAVAAWNGYNYWQNRQSTQAAALSDAVQAAVQAGDKVRIEQAFGDIKDRYGRTTQAGQAGLSVAKWMADAGNTDGAKAALGWVAESAGDDGYKALAKLRLAALLMDQKAYDDALAQLSGSFPAQFAAVVADRKGDVLVLQNKRAEAVAEYQRAYKAFDANVEYRQLVEVKLNALGAQPQVVAAADAQGAAK